MGPLRGDWGELSQMGLAPCKGTADRPDPSHHVRTQWGVGSEQEAGPQQPRICRARTAARNTRLQFASHLSVASVPAAGTHEDTSFPIFSRKLKSKGNTVKGKTSLFNVLPRDLRDSQWVKEKSKPHKQLRVI